jgi:hypothetical protein
VHCSSLPSVANRVGFPCRSLELNTCRRRRKRGRTKGNVERPLAARVLYSRFRPDLHSRSGWAEAGSPWLSMITETRAGVIT